MSGNKDTDQHSEQDRLTPQSLHPLDPEDALRGFMQVDPEKVKERLERSHEESASNGGSE